MRVFAVVRELMFNGLGFSLQVPNRVISNGARHGRRVRRRRNCVSGPPGFSPWSLFFSRRLFGFDIFPEGTLGVILFFGGVSLRASCTGSRRTWHFHPISRIGGSAQVVARL